MRYIDAVVCDADHIDARIDHPWLGWIPITLGRFDVPTAQWFAAVSAILPAVAGTIPMHEASA